MFFGKVKCLEGTRQGFSGDARNKPFPTPAGDLSHPSPPGTPGDAMIEWRISEDWLKASNGFSPSDGLEKLRQHRSNLSGGQKHHVQNLADRVVKMED